MATVTHSFPGALGKLADKLSGEHTLKVGFLKGNYPDGTPIATVAAWNEFGVTAHGQPPRPFFRNMIAAQSGKWGRLAGELLKANGSIEDTLDILGQEIQGRIKESINALTEPKLAASTIAKKHGRTKPLIDSALMVNSVSFEIVEK